MTKAQFVGLVSNCRFLTYNCIVGTERISFEMLAKSLLSPIACLPYPAEGAGGVLVKTKTINVHFGFNHSTYFQFGLKWTCVTTICVAWIRKAKEP